MKCYGVIMAGGGGTRFWPLSRQAVPKQLLNLSGKGLMINETIERITQVIREEDVFIVTNAAQARTMEDVVVPGVRRDHILVEPAGRNTAACVGYAAMEIVKKYGDGVMCTFAADHNIRQPEVFAGILRQAVQCVEEEDKLLTIGITPSFPCTAYGNIRYDKNDRGQAKQVLEFKEKPDLETAREYVASGEYAWNSGMFVWKASTILKNFQTYLPEVYQCLTQIGEAMGTDREQEIIYRIYPQIPSISVDYGIMEKSPDVKVIHGEFGWSDVGSWDNMGVLHPEDDRGNVACGETVLLDTSGCVVYAGKKLVTTLGVEDLIIVETDDAIMVCAKDRAQDVKKIVETLKDKGMTEYL